METYLYCPTFHFMAFTGTTLLLPLLILLSHVTSLLRTTFLFASSPHHIFLFLSFLIFLSHFPSLSALHTFWLFTLRLEIVRLRTLSYSASKSTLTWRIAWTRAIRKGKRRPETSRHKLQDNIKTDMLKRGIIKYGYETFIIVFYGIAWREIR